jgi:hypothetical protein
MKIKKIGLKINREMLFGCLFLGVIILAICVMFVSIVSAETYNVNVSKPLDSNIITLTFNGTSSSYDISQNSSFNSTFSFNSEQTSASALNLQDLLQDFIQDLFARANADEQNWFQQTFLVVLTNNTDKMIELQNRELEANRTYNICAGELQSCYSQAYYCNETLNSILDDKKTMGNTQLVMVIIIAIMIIICIYFVLEKGGLIRSLRNRAEVKL